MKCRKLFVKPKTKKKKKNFTFWKLHSKSSVQVRAKNKLFKSRLVYIRCATSVCIVLQAVGAITMKLSEVWERKTSMKLKKKFRKTLSGGRTHSITLAYARSDAVRAREPVLAYSWPINFALTSNFVQIKASILILNIYKDFVWNFRYNCDECSRCDCFDDAVGTSGLRKCAVSICSVCDGCDNIRMRELLSVLQCSLSFPWHAVV